jgi:hypothetical protein
MPETPTDRDLLKLCDVVENYDRTALPRFVLRLAAAVRRLLAERAALEAELAQARGAALTPAASPWRPGLYDDLVDDLHMPA